MKILVCGAGVLGCNLAADLSRAGKEVTLLARGQWAKTLRERGLRIKNMFSPRTSTRRIPIATEEMSAMNRDIKRFFDENGAEYPTWKELEKEAGEYLKDKNGFERQNKRGQSVRTAP